MENGTHTKYRRELINDVHSPQHCQPQSCTKFWRPLMLNLKPELNVPSALTTVTEMTMWYPIAYVDDTSAVMPHEDIIFFIQEFERLATPIECRLNPNKTCILTSI